MIISKKVISIFICLILAVSMAVPVYAGSTIDQKVSQIDESDLLANPKSDYSIEELLVIFPAANISAAIDKQVANSARGGNKPEAVTRITQPVQEFVHEFPDGSKLYLDVFSDGSRGLYGYTLGAVIYNTTMSITYGDTLVFWKYPYGIIPFVNTDWEYKVTHTKYSGGGSISSHAHIRVFGHSVSYTEGTNYVTYKADLYCDFSNDPTLTTTERLTFNAASLTVTPY